jgi:hypothetical protein
MRSALQKLVVGPFVIGAVAMLPGGGAAQIISLRTVPIASGEQYVQLPSSSFGMGGVSIAMKDMFADPFSNPAMGARLDGVHAFGAPTFYHIGTQDGGGRTLTTGILGRSNALFGGFAVALQELNQPQRQSFLDAPTIVGDAGSRPTSYLRNDPSNKYFQGLIGTRIGRRGPSVGIGVSHSALQAVDGMSLLYVNSVNVMQSGGITDLRAGVLKESGSGWFEAVAVHSRVDITHTVDYQQYIWNDPRVPPSAGNPILTEWSQVQRDVSRTNALRTSYVRELRDAPGWRIGATVTANRKTHPHLPDYDLARLPRDPGTSTAFDIGVGIAKTLNATRFGFDVNYVPARSRTWADSDTAVIVAQNGGTLQPGEHTVDNQFDFSNLRMAIGVGREGSSSGWQLGLAVLGTSYTLDQQNHILQQNTSTSEGWTEWVPTWGLHHNFGDISVRYSGRLVLKGFPGTVTQADFSPVMSSGQDFLVPVTNNIFLQDYSIFTNQFSVSVAIGRDRN